jgi:hypothetical protein
MARARILLEAISPNGNIQAVVEDNGKTVYFYLSGAPDTGFGARACWVRNLRKAPREFDAKDMKRGNPPMLPRDHCSHSQGATPLTPEELDIVWFEEGDSAALLSGSEVLSVIPSWSGSGGFHGYARDCIGQSPVCWELSTSHENALFERIAQAQEFWDSWATEKDPWPSIQSSMCAAIESQIGAYSRYYAIDAGHWPPKAMLRIDLPEAVVLVTIGVSIRPQPGVEMHTDKPEKLRRIELGMCLSNRFSDADIEAIAQYMSGQASLPWDQYTWLAEYHTITSDAIPPTKHENYPAVLLLSHPQGSPSVQLPEYRGDPVNLLWMVPITDKERQFAVENGGEELEARLAAAGYGWVHSIRSGLRLS